MARFFQFAGAAFVFSFDFLVLQRGGGESFDFREFLFEIQVGACELAREEDRNGSGQKEDDHTPDRY
jgi:hypothetical protein